ncbi:LysR family transcriptional regulator [Pseudomonas gingeri]|uniref:LysR family transcriptional regulator n=1 Tax=Pseudomonas gingeri TaxID=117681 RepID=UPI0015A26FAB|nr:LysR family transcriptional regulator [Pseudomonas gingeri]NWE48718.1 LysR family transcriptional regulator [Pseudomonas gingeri]NWE72230.1 LysR family transcriptional regulator [Pseudomonas gingeri]
MRQDQLDGLVTFVHVAELSSFTAAATRLGVSPSAVSQVIRNLEQRLGIALFNRTTRSVALSEAGVRFLERVMPAVRELSAAAEELGDSSGQPSGLLRLNVPRSAYLTVLQPILKGFLDAYPEIDLEISLENSLVDIVRQGYDCGIRFGGHVEQDMVAVRIGPPLAVHVVASPAYLEQHGIPLHPRELVGHPCFGFRPSGSGVVERWAFGKDGENLQIAVNGRLIVNDSGVLVQSALDGQGIAYMVNGYIEPFLADGRLVRLLADWSPTLPSYTLYYPDRRQGTRKLRALIDYLKAVDWTQTPGCSALLRTDARPAG